MFRFLPPVAGYTAAILICLLPAALIFGLQITAIVMLAEIPAAATLSLLATDWILIAAVLLGVARLRSHVHQLQHRLAVALTDPVTGLPVRRVAEDAITAAGPDAVLTVALADIDRLHDINHGPGGYTAGDDYLTETGRRLQQAATDDDLVARLGGDEFVLITRRTSAQLAEDLTAAFAEPAVGTGIRALEVSVGICRMSGADPHQLLGCADLAMFTAKQHQTRIEIYDPARDGQPLPPVVRPATRHRSGQ